MVTLIVKSTIDRVSGVLDRSSSKLTEIKKDLNLVNVWRSFYPNQKQFTYISPVVSLVHYIGNRVMVLSISCFMDSCSGWVNKQI